MDRVSVGPVKGLRIAVAAFLLSVVLFIFAIGGSLFLLNQRSDDLASFQTELRNGLVRNCEVNGNPLRMTVQGLLRQQIRNAESPSVRRSFPDSLLDAIVAADEKQLKEIAPVDCPALYP